MEKIKQELLISELTKLNLFNLNQRYGLGLTEEDLNYAKRTIAISLVALIDQKGYDLMVDTEDLASLMANSLEFVKEDGEKATLVFNGENFTFYLSESNQTETSLSTQMTFLPESNTIDRFGLNVNSIGLTPEGAYRTSMFSEVKKPIMGADIIRGTNYNFFAINNSELEKIGCEIPIVPKNEIMTDKVTPFIKESYTPTIIGSLDPVCLKVPAYAEDNNTAIEEYVALDDKTVSVDYINHLLRYQQLEQGFVQTANDLDNAPGY